MTLDITQIKKIRKHLDLTQSQFAQKIGISQSMIAKIEAGRLDPTYSYVKKIESVINSLTKHEEKEARDIMIKKIKLMNKNEFSQLPVLQAGKVVGLVTESSILEKDLEQIGNLEAKEIMI